LRASGSFAGRRESSRVLRRARRRKKPKKKATAVTGRVAAELVAAQRRRIRRGRVIQSEGGDEAKPLDVARCRGLKETDEAEGPNAQSACIGMPNAWSPHALAPAAHPDQPHHVQCIVPPSYIANEVIYRR
jgi:hypothetical protein